MILRLGAIAAVGTALLASTVAAQDYRVVSGSRLRRGETELRARVEFAAGTLSLVPGEPGTLYRYSLVYDAGQFDPVTSYDPQAHRVRLGVNSRGSGGISYRRAGGTRQRLEASFSPATPLSLEVSFGAGSAELELGGLSLTDATIKAGAGEATLRFSTPNAVTCRELTLEVGAIDFATRSLGNARCQRIGVKGAAGNVVLDLTGQWPAGTTSVVDIAAALGAVTLRLPQEVGVEADLKGFLAAFDRSGLLRRGASYYSANWDTAATKLRISLRAAVGDVQVEWVK